VSHQLGILINYDNCISEDDENFTNTNEGESLNKINLDQFRIPSDCKSFVEELV